MLKVLKEWCRCNFWEHTFSKSNVQTSQFFLILMLVTFLFPSLWIIIIQSDYPTTQISQQYEFFTPFSNLFLIFPMLLYAIRHKNQCQTLSVFKWPKCQYIFWTFFEWYYVDLQLYHLTLKMMSPSEAKLLRPRLNRLYHVLDPGFADLTWNALGIADFVKMCTSAINEFRNVINQVGYRRFPNFYVQVELSIKRYHFEMHHDFFTVMHLDFTNGVSLFSPIERCYRTIWFGSVTRLGGFHFAAPPRFGVLGSFFGFFF